MNPYGRDELMAVAAVRYCLGRQSYIVGDCVDWLIEQWPNFSSGTQSTIKRDIETVFFADDYARENGHEYYHLGMDMDRREWERARNLWND